MGKRAYVLQDRAKSQQATRRRIVDATALLHETVGPKNTTISSVAEKAGVQRLTVYRHFPTETELFQACTSHWLEQNPLPDPEKWQYLQGLERVRVALATLYAYYRGTRRMWTTAHRDEADVVALQEPMNAVRDYLGRIARGLLDGLDTGGSQRDAVRATLCHAVRFPTWLSLSAERLDAVDMADLVCAWLRGLGVR